MASKKKVSVEETPAAEAHEVLGLQQYETLLHLTESIDPKGVKPFRADMRVVRTNVKKGAAALLAEEPRLKKELPELNLKNLRRAPDLALALQHASFLTLDARGASTDLPALMSESTQLRQFLLTNAESLVLAGIFEAKKVEAIRKGRGALDSADDCVRLAALYQENASAVRGKTPVTATILKRAAFLGSTLTTELKPAGTKRGVGKKVLTATDIRDRFGAILVADWDLARRAAVWLFGLEQTQVPPLGSVFRVKEKKPKE